MSKTMEVPEGRQVMGGDRISAPLEVGLSFLQVWGVRELLELLQTYLGIYGAGNPHQ